jgi:FkbM family methyltransferase
MNPVVPAIEQLASAFNGLALWRREQPVWGRRMRARTFDRTLYLWMHRHGFMGFAERAALRALVKPGMTVVDVGANLGLYSLLLSELVGPGGRVVSFEPDPDLCSLLQENCGVNLVGNIDLRPMALGLGSGRLVLQRLTLNSGDNHLGTSERPAFCRPVEVEVAAFDELMPGLRPHFIKVDVQGWELRVLRGMERALRGDELSGLFVEIWPTGLRRAGDDPEGLYDFLNGLGLRFYTCGAWREVDREAFLALVARTKGSSHIDLFATRGEPPRALHA